MELVIMTDSGLQVRSRVSSLDKFLERLSTVEVGGVSMIRIPSEKGEAQLLVRSDRLMAIIVQDETNIEVPSGLNGVRLVR